MLRMLIEFYTYPVRSTIFLLLLVQKWSKSA